MLSFKSFLLSETAWNVGITDPEAVPEVVSKKQDIGHYRNKVKIGQPCQRSPQNIGGHNTRSLLLVRRGEAICECDVGRDENES